VSGLLIAFAIYIIVDRLFTVGWVGKSIDITPAFAVVSIVTGTFLVVVLLKAAYGGVTP
jgi:hypothetical protein